MEKWSVSLGQGSTSCVVREGFLEVMARLISVGPLDGFRSLGFGQLSESCCSPRN
jgi:hypothetical protein